ncbi:MAG: hypothetical protein LQ352_002921 [Teloschistes flavicans]|nr:MAG: hypothetical protein LQ352_002921 [Teloschistes flavicans]
MDIRKEDLLGVIPTSNAELDKARVKSVLSGDTVVLSSINEPGLEKLFSLAYVSAPRFSRDSEEPFAFQSREFLRRMTVGKVVQLYSLYQASTGTMREYGVMILQKGELLPHTSIGEGWAKVRKDARGKVSTPEADSFFKKLEQLENKAKTNSSGVWASKGGSIETNYDLPDPKAFVEKYTGKSIDAIVERVLAGDRMILRLLLSPSNHVQVIVAVAGIRAPRKAFNAEGRVHPAEPLAEESFQFVETRLLQRNVKADVFGLTPQNQLICAVIHPNGSIADFLLKDGLAQCNDFHSALLGADMKAMRQAEKHAKDSKSGIYKGHVETKASGGPEVEATVSRVVRPDTVTIRIKAGSDKTVQLSSIRGPKTKDAKQGPFEPEAKEYLRKRLIGKHVKVTIDGIKPASDGYEEREVATIIAGNKNVALALVEAGYASVIRHRKDDNDRSPYYDELVAAEETAQKGQKGMWSSKAPAAKAYQDYSESLQKAKIQCSVLQRQKKIPAVVDYVKSGSRFTVLIPRENAKLTLVLSGIRAPRSARNPTEKAEPFGQEAHDFANRRCLQRDVEIDVENTDKQGGFIGVLYINRENFAKLLLDEGFATVHAYSAEQSAHANELFAAEQKAKDARKGVWHDYDPAAVEGAGDALPATNESTTNSATNVAPSSSSTSSAPMKKDYRDVIISHIDPSTCALKLQHVSPTTSHALNSLMSAFRTFHVSPSNSSSTTSPPNTGEIVAAKFSEDKEWYRARIRRNDRDAKTSEVLFIDYGNSESVAWKDIRPLGPQDRFGTGKLKAQAVDAMLSFCQFPTVKEEYMADAERFLRNNIEGKQLVASVDFIEKSSSAAGGGEGTLWVTMFDPNGRGKDEEVNVNEEVVAEGLAMVPRKLKAWEHARGNSIKKMKELEEEAKRERMGMWEYGDLTEE